VKGPEIMRGQSLRGVIEKPSEAGHEYVVSEMAAGGPGGGSRSFMLRTKKCKYMVFPQGGERGEMFFDMEADPGEMKNLAGEASLAAEIERHRKLLAEWNQTTGEAKCPVKPDPLAGRGRRRAGRRQRVPVP
jgi:glucosamine-6-phosphate deaminase